MAYTSDPRHQHQVQHQHHHEHRHPHSGRTPQERRLRLLSGAATGATSDRPAVVPVLRPDEPVTPGQDAALTRIAQQARLGDPAARDLLWRAFEARLEPAVASCRRMTWHIDWMRRDGRPWELDDLQQEAWLVFTDLTLKWDGEGSFVPYVTAYFPWRLRNAMRRLGPPRRAITVSRVPERFAECGELLDAEGEALLTQIVAALSPVDALVLRLRVMEGMGSSAIARRLGVSRRTVTRRWSRVQRVASEMLHGSRRATG